MKELLEGSVYPFKMFRSPDHYDGITVCFKVELFGLTDEIGSVDGNDYIYAVLLTNCRINNPCVGASDMTDSPTKGGQIT